MTAIGKRLKDQRGRAGKRDGDFVTPTNPSKAAAPANANSTAAPYTLVVRRFREPPGLRKARNFALIFWSDFPSFLGMIRFTSVTIWSAGLLAGWGVNSTVGALAAATLLLYFAWFLISHVATIWLTSLKSTTLTTMSIDVHALEKRSHIPAWCFWRLGTWTLVALMQVTDTTRRSIERSMLTSSRNVMERWVRDDFSHKQTEMKRVITLLRSIVRRAALCTLFDAIAIDPALLVLCVIAMALHGSQAKEQLALSCVLLVLLMTHVIVSLSHARHFLREQEGDSPSASEGGKKKKSENVMRAPTAMEMESSTHLSEMHPTGTVTSEASLQRPVSERSLPTSFPKERSLPATDINRDPDSSGIPRTVVQSLGRGNPDQTIQHASSHSPGSGSHPLSQLVSRHSRDAHSPELVSANCAPLVRMSLPMPMPAFIPVLPSGVAPGQSRGDAAEFDFVPPGTYVNHQSRAVRTSLAKGRPVSHGQIAMGTFDPALAGLSSMHHGMLSHALGQVIHTHVHSQMHSQGPSLPPGPHMSTPPLPISMSMGSSSPVPPPLQRPDSGNYSMLMPRLYAIERPSVPAGTQSPYSNASPSWNTQPAAVPFPPMPTAVSLDGHGRAFHSNGGRDDEMWSEVSGAFNPAIHDLPRNSGGFDGDDRHRSGDDSLGQRSSSGSSSVFIAIDPFQMQSNTQVPSAPLWFPDEYLALRVQKRAGTNT
jgi:hypothetical protein